MFDYPCKDMALTNIVHARNSFYCFWTSVQHDSYSDVDHCHELPHHAKTKYCDAAPCHEKVNKSHQRVRMHMLLGCVHA